MTTWDEGKHPRGQPENAGQFGPGGGGSATKQDGAPKRRVAEGAGAREGFDNLAHPAQAARWYAGGGYEHINAALRGQAEHSQETEAAATALTAFIEQKGNLGKSETLHRVIDVQDLQAFLGQFRKGARLHMNGFVSTSRKPMYGRFGGQGAVAIQIETDRGLDMNQHGLAEQPDEQEVLLGHGWQYEVVGVGVLKERSGHKFPAVRLRMVSAERGASPEARVQKREGAADSDDELVTVRMHQGAAT